MPEHEDEVAVQLWRLAVAKERILQFEEDMGRRPRTLEEITRGTLNSHPKRLAKPRPEAFEPDEGE